MAFNFIDIPTATAVGAATTQDAQVAALVAPWSGGNVMARGFEGATLLFTETYGPWQINAGVTPRRVTPGAFIARTWIVLPTVKQDKMVFRVGSTDIFSISLNVSPSTAGDFNFASVVLSLSRERIDIESGLALTAKATLPTGSGPTLLTLSGNQTGTTGSPSTVVATLNAPATVAVTVTPTPVAGVTFSTPATIPIGQTTTSYVQTRAADGQHAVGATTSPSMSVTGFTFSSSTVAAGSPGTITLLGSESLTTFIDRIRAQVPSPTGETYANANNRMGVISGIDSYNSIILFVAADGRWKAGHPIGGGHDESYDDGFYSLDLQTGLWEITLAASLACSRATSGDQLTPGTDNFGEIASGAAVGRPVTCHVWMHLTNKPGGDPVLVTVGAWGSGGSGLSRQAHRFNRSSGVWERYGDLRVTTGDFSPYVAVHDPVRSRFYRFDKELNKVEWIPDNNPAATWTTIVPTNPMPAGTGMIYASVGYFPPLDCFVRASFRPDFPVRVSVMNAANVQAGWFDVTTSGTPVPYPTSPGESAGSGVDTGMEYMPAPHGKFALAGVTNQRQMYYLKPSGTLLQPWVFTNEVFTGSGAATWEWNGVNGSGSVSGAQQRVRWSTALNALIVHKRPHVPIEVWHPVPPDNWAARSTEPGVVIAYDFSAAPANGGDWKWGSLKATPKITCWAKNDDQFAAVRNIDTAIYPPGSTASLRWDVPAGSGERADEWRISIDNIADQFGENTEFWVQWRTRMDVTYATFGFADRSGGDIPGGTTFKHLLCGEGMQLGLSWVPNGSLYGFEGVGSSFAQNTIAYTHSDFEGETNLVAPWVQGPAQAAGYGFKYPGAYHGKPGYYPFLTRGQDSSFFTYHNSGNEGAHVAACQFQLGTGNPQSGYTDQSTCFQYPVDQWFTLMMHFVVGPRGHGFSTLGDGLVDVPAVRLSASQILLTNDSYTEHFNPPAAAPKKCRIRGTITGAIDATITTKGPGLTLTFTAAVDSASSGTLTAAAVNGTFGCYFSHGQFRTVTITGGTAVSWNPALPAASPCTSGQSIGGTTLNFTAGVDGATSGTLTVSRPDATFFGFTFSNGDVRDVTVSGGTAATWTPALLALATTSGVLQQATLTLSGLTGTIANEALLVDEYISGFTNSTVEYWGAQPGGAMQLLHRKSGFVLRVGNFQLFEGQTATAKYGTFAWTTFMTGKSLTQNHPTAKVWVGQIIIKAGATAPATPL